MLDRWSARSSRTSAAAGSAGRPRCGRSSTCSTEEHALRHRGRRHPGRDVRDPFQDDEPADRPVDGRPGDLGTLQARRPPRARRVATPAVRTTTSGGRCRHGHRRPVAGCSACIRTTTPSTRTATLGATGENSFGPSRHPGGPGHGLGAMEQYSPLPGGGGRSSTSRRSKRSRRQDDGDRAVGRRRHEQPAGVAAGSSSSRRLRAGRRRASPGLRPVARATAMPTPATACRAVARRSLRPRTARSTSRVWLTIDIPLPTDYAAYQSGWWKIEYDVGGTSARHSTSRRGRSDPRAYPVHLVLP